MSSSLVPSEVSLLQKFSVNKLLENFSYDLIFPMDLPTDPGATSTSDKRPKLPPLRTSFPFDEVSHQFEDSASTTPSSIQSDYASFPGGTKMNSSMNSHSANNSNNWYSSRPNISQPDNYQEKSLLFSPPKRYLSDSNLNNYPFGCSTNSSSGEMSPLESSSMYSSTQNNNHNLMSSPFKSNDRHGGLALDFEPYHTRSSFNLNYGGASSTPPTVQKVDKSTMYSSDILNNLLALNSSNSAEAYAANMKGLEQTMRMLQTQQHHMEPRPQSVNHSYNRQSSINSTSSFSRQSSASGDESLDFRQSSQSFSNNNNMTNGLSKYPSGGNTTTSSNSNFSSCSSIDMNGHQSCSSSPGANNSVRTWNGIIPTRTSKAVTYSQKVFLGGIPWETSEDTLKHIFSRFGPLRVEWPGKDPNYSTKPKGCVYIIFENEKQVRDLLASCQLVRERHGGDDGKFFYKFPWKNMKTKNVEVIPWNIADSNYVSSSQILDPSKTIFVGALHGKLTAEGLALIMNDLFDGVVYAGIDTDKHKYPLGAGRVTFNNPQSYMKAIQTGYLLIKTPIFTKKVQIDPYLEDNLCSTCNIHHGPYYCRELSCFRYFCRVCWQLQHSDAQRGHHRPLTRSSKSQSIVFND